MHAGGVEVSTNALPPSSRRPSCPLGSGSFKLEVERWHRQYDEEEFDEEIREMHARARLRSAPLTLGCPPLTQELFARVDSDDEEAAQLRCMGEWTSSRLEVKSSRPLA